MVTGANDHFVPCPGFQAVMVYELLVGKGVDACVTPGSEVLANFRPSHTIILSASLTAHSMLPRVPRPDCSTGLMLLTSLAFAGTGVSVGGAGVSVGGTGVSVGDGGTGVFVGVGV